MPITRKQISAAASTSNPPPSTVKKQEKGQVSGAALPVSDDDLFEQSAIQVSSASRQTRTINHQIPKDLRKQLHVVLQQQQSREEEDENSRDFMNHGDADVKKIIRSSSNLLVKRSIKSPNVKHSTPMTTTANRSSILSKPIDDGLLDSDSIFDVPISSMSSPSRRPSIKSKPSNGKVSDSTNPLNSNTEPITSNTTTITTATTATTTTTTSSNTSNVNRNTPIKTIRATSFASPNNRIPVSNSLASPAAINRNSQVLAEVRRTPLTMAEKKRRQAALTSASQTNISALKIPKQCVNFQQQPNPNSVIVVDENSQQNIPQTPEKTSKHHFIRNEATESAPPDITETLKVQEPKVEAEQKKKEQQQQQQQLEDHEIGLIIQVPPPPKLEDLETLDPELFLRLKCGTLKDDPSAAFISESDHQDIEMFLESFTSPELSKTLIPVAIIGEGTFSTVYKVIDRTYHECENSSWMEYSRQNPLDWLKLWRCMYNDGRKELATSEDGSNGDTITNTNANTTTNALVLYRDGKRCVDRNGNSLTSTRKSGGKSRLNALLRQYFLEWAMRSLDSLLPSQIVDEEAVLGSISPRLLQSAMYRFRPYFIALKRINSTSSPQRILDEISFLKFLGGKSNVVPIINGLRCEDQVLVTFPYFYSEDFREFLSSGTAMNVSSIANYMRSLFVSLAHLHAHNVIHRDVKPSNFLFAPENGGRAVLLDFGLAQKGSSSSRAHGQGRSSYAAQPPPPTNHRNLEKERKKLQAVNTILNSFSTPGGVEDSCEKLNQLVIQLGPGYFNNDPRAAMKASRAGTRGFRAPEVLFKSSQQSTALDIWSAGVILLTLLTRRYPFFQSSDDFDAIVEIANIFGNEEMSAAAKMYNRRWRCNIPSVPDCHVTWPVLCTNLNPQFAPEIPEECYSLLAACLNLKASQRITAKAALKHPFILKYSQ